MTEDQTPSHEGLSEPVGDVADTGCPHRDDAWRLRVQDVEDILSAAEVELACVWERAVALAAVAAHIRDTGEIPPEAEQPQQIEGDTA